MKRSKLVKHLNSFGCKIQREGRRHTVFMNGDGTRKSAMPRHTEIKSNLVLKICKDLGISAPEER